MTSLTPHKSEHYVVVMELMLFENVVLSELCSERNVSLNKDSSGSSGLIILE